MQLQKAERKRAKIKMALQGPSGSGKTMSALLLAYGLCGDWTKIAVIDTENHSAELYAHLGAYNVVNLTAPYSPERYQQAINLCEQSNMEVIIIDSISHEWEGNGGILNMHSNMTGNSFTNWGKLTPRHNAFIQFILQSPCHVIGTIRSKQDYVLQEKNGKLILEKIGLKGITREGIDYEFTIVLDIDIKHNAVSSKDRTGLFMGHPGFRISIDTGKQILEWCNNGVPSQQTAAKQLSTVESLQQQIDKCTTEEALIALYKLQSKEIQERHHATFTNRKNEITKSVLQDYQVPKVARQQLNGSTNHG